MIIPPPKDGYIHTRAESAKLTALCGKSVFIEFTDGSDAAGFLHITTLATRTECLAFDNRHIIGITSKPRRAAFSLRNPTSNISRSIEL